MTEPASKENARFGERLVAAGLALKNPPNGDGLDAEERRAPITLGFLQDVILGIAASVGKEIAALKRSVAEARQLRIDEIADEVRDEIKRLGVLALEKRLAELEARPTMSYEGVWDEQKAYNAGSFVTFQGGLWHCEQTNVGVRPGAGSSSWKLAVKRGKG